METKANIQLSMVSSKQTRERTHILGQNGDSKTSTKMQPEVEYRKAMALLQKLINFMCMQQSRNRKQSIGFHIIAAIHISSLIGCTYTAMVYEWLDKFKAAIMFFIFSMLIVKYMDEKSMRSLIALTVEIENIYIKNANAAHGSRIHGIFAKYARYTELVVKSVLYGLSIYALTFIAMSALNSLFAGRLLPTLGFYMPGVDENTTWGITLLVLQQMALVLFGITTEIAYDATLYAVFLNMSMLSAVIVAHIEEFQKSLQIEGEVAGIGIKRKQIDLICMHSKYNEIIRKLDKCFYNACMAQMFSAVMFTTLTIFMVVKDNYMPAAPIVVFGMASIAANCVLGTFIEINSRNIYAAIASLDWYLLPRNELRNHAILLHRSQQLQRIYMAGYKELSMETCLSTYKAVYSYTMILYRST